MGHGHSQMGGARPRRRRGEGPKLHDHIHLPSGKSAAGKLWASAMLVAVFAAAETYAGHAARSLSLASDAGHMAGDALALGMAAASATLARGGPDARRTFGWAKAESVAALLNAAAMLALIGWIAWQAVERIAEPSGVGIDGPLVVAVGAMGLAMNAGIAWMLWRSGDKSVGARAALLHAGSDALGSVGAVLAGLCWSAFGWRWVDPALSMVIAAMVGKASLDLLREAWGTLTDAAPPGIDVGQVQCAIEGVAGVRAVLDLHIWQLAPGEPSLSAHLRIEPGRSCQPVIAQVEGELAERFGIRHSTIQPHEQELLETREAPASIGSISKSVEKSDGGEITH